jgi:Skp family chaperone for outer membrane proteins
MSKKTKMMLRITKKLGRIIKKIAAKDRYDYIFNNAALLHAPRHVDLTNEVIRRYNK